MTTWDYSRTQAGACKPKKIEQNEELRVLDMHFNEWPGASCCWRRKKALPAITSKFSFVHLLWFSQGVTAF